MYPNYVYSVLMISPAANNYIRGSGPKANVRLAGFAAALRGTALAAADSPDVAQQQRICREMQGQAF